MKKMQFYKSEKGQGNEDWYYLVIDQSAPALSVLHTWSHSVGTASFRSDEQIFSLQEFAAERPNQYRKLLEWLSIKLETQ